MSLFFTNEGYYPNIIVYLNVIHCPKDIHVPQWIRLAPIQMTYLLIKQGLKVMSGFVTLPESIPVSNLCTCLSLSLDDFPVGNLEDWFVYRTWMTSRDPISMETSMGILFCWQSSWATKAIQRGSCPGQCRPKAVAGNFQFYYQADSHKRVRVRQSNVTPGKDSFPQNEISEFLPGVIHWSHPLSHIMH